MKILQDMRTYLKYGKIIHQSPSGNYIRKKVATSGISPTSPDIETTKTIFNKDNKIIKTINRKFFDYDDEAISLCNVDYFDSQSNKIIGKTRSKEYRITNDEKTIIDYAKPNCDYSMEMLPNGKTKYEIMYPEITIIKDGEVKTAQNNKTYIA